MTEKRKEKVAYEKRILVYLDVLGFRRLVEQSKDDASKIHEMYSCLESAREEAKIIMENAPSLRYQKGEAEDLNFHMFSDTITLSWPYRSFHSFDYMAVWTMVFQHRIWKEHRLFVRGAVVCGDLYDKDDIIFGPAIVNAYDLAENRAEWPRVLVDRGILGILRQEDRERASAEFLREDARGLIYIDYLRDLFHSYVQGIIKRENLGYLDDPIEFLRLHKLRIEQAANNIGDNLDRAGILKKYRALAAYHNAVIDQQCKALSGLAKSTAFLKALSNEEIHQLVKEYTYAKIDSADNPTYVDAFFLESLAIHKLITRSNDIDRIARENPAKFKRVFFGGFARELKEVREELRNLRIHREALPMSNDH